MYYNNRENIELVYSNIISFFWEDWHAGAKLRVDSHNEVMRRLLDEALRMCGGGGGFNAQEASNIQQPQ